MIDVNQYSVLSYITHLFSLLQPTLLSYPYLNSLFPSFPLSLSHVRNTLCFVHIIISASGKKKTKGERSISCEEMKIRDMRRQDGGGGEQK